MFSDVHLLCPDAAVCSRKIKSLTERHHRSSVHLNRLFPQTLSSFSTAILKGHRVLGTMGQCMLGYIGSVEATLQSPWPSHASVPLVARVSCQLSGNRSHCHLFWFFQFEITTVLVCYSLTYIQIEFWSQTSFESILSDLCNVWNSI